jgi:hypothetical protein
MKLAFPLRKGEVEWLVIEDATVQIRWLPLRDGRRAYRVGRSKNPRCARNQNRAALRAESKPALRAESKPALRAESK